MNSTPLQYIILGTTIGMVSGYSLMFTTTVLWGGPEYVRDRDDELFLNRNRPWYLPFDFKVVCWMIKKNFGEDWSIGEWDITYRAKVCWEISLMICNFIVFWPIITIAATVCWIIFAIKTLIGMIK
jgi:hypothetical protein